MTIAVKDANGNIVNVEAPVAVGRVAAAASKPVTLSNEDFAAIDGIETAIASTNTKLDTLHTDLATTLAGLVDGLEGILGTTAGAAVITDANGTLQQYLRGLIKQWIAGTLVVGPGTSLIGKVKTKFIAATGTALTRPANTTPYTAGDSVSNNATAGSVTAQSITVTDLNDEPITIEGFRLVTNDTGFRGKSVRVFLHNSDPTANSGVGAGDNALFSNKVAGAIGSLSGTFSAASGEYSDGAIARLQPDQGSRITTKPVSGAATIYWLMKTLDDATSSANSTTFTPTVEGFQGGS